MAGEGATRPLLVRAAQDIAESVGLAETLVDVLRERAFQPYAEGLRQFLVIRLGDEEEGAEAFRELRIAVAALDAEALLAPPGVRANLYSLARALVQEKWEGSGAERRRGRGGVPWWRPPGGVSQRYLFALDKLRRELPAGEAELLELRHARELELEEIAHVLELPEADVGQRLALATAQARRVVAGVVPESQLRLSVMLLEAFAVMPSASTEAGRTAGGAQSLEPGEVIGDRYEVEKQVGSGGMGNVYRAIDTKVPGHVVALKLLHQPAKSDAARASALRELHLIASVFHPSVVQFKDHGWHEDRLWFVMPWYDGESLQARIEREPLTRAEARTIFEPLALALGTMHLAGIRHQDIKPDNIFLARIEGVRPDGEKQLLPVLLDLGVAAKEAELVLAGTPLYFAPEVAAQYARVAEPHPVTPKADVFSLCLSLRNALEPTTRELVAAGAVERFIENRAAMSPRPTQGVDLRFLERYFDRWLAVDPSRRPTAVGLAAELAVLTAPEEKRERRLKLLRWLGPLLLALVAVFGSVVYGLSRQAEFQKLEAARARLEAEHARMEAQRARLEVDEAQGDLSAAAERQRQLEEDVARTLTQYRSSEMTSEQLTTKLAQAEGQFRMTRELYAEEKRRAQLFRSQLEEVRAEKGRVDGELAGVRTRLEKATARADGLEAHADELQRRTEDLDAELDAAGRDAADAAARAAELGERAAALERQLEAERAAKVQADARAAAAAEELARVRAALAAAQQRVANLERTHAARRPPGVTRPPGGEGGGGSDDGDGDGAAAAEPTPPAAAPPPPPSPPRPPGSP